MEPLTRPVLETKKKQKYVSIPKDAPIKKGEFVNIRKVKMVEE